MFPNKIKETRKVKRLTQGDLAELLETSQNQIYLYESGKVEPRASSLVRLSEVLNVPVDYLLGTKFAEGNNVANEKSDMRTELLDNREVALVNMYRTLNDKNKDLVIKITTLFCE